MAVTILAGRAGQLRPLLMAQVREARQAGLRALILVPEQLTLMMERSLMDGLALPGLMDIEVFSPSRLRRMVFDRGGRPAESMLDDRGRRMALSRALLRLRDKLKYYQGAADAPGLPERLAGLLSELKKSGMTPQGLAEHAQTLPAGGTRAKEEDLSAIWEAYEELLSGRFLDDEGIEEEVIRRLRPSGVAEGAAVWVYGFDDLPMPRCRLLAALGGCAAQVTVMLTMDTIRAADGRIFLAQHASAQRLLRTLEMAGEEGKVVWAGTEAADRDPALAYLERRLFDPKKQPFPEATEALGVLAAPNPFAEAMAAAAWLWEEHERGVAWSEMAVAMSAESAYAPVISMALRASGIPFYLASKMPATRHGLVRLLLAALRLCGEGWRQEDVLAVMKSGFSPLTEEECFALENYALENGLRGKKWEEPLHRGEQAAEMDPLRQRLMAPLLRLRDGLRRAEDAQDSMTAVFGLLQDVDAYTRLREREEKLLAQQMQAEAAQNRQVWRMILETLEQQRALLDGSREPVTQVAAWLAAGFEHAEISALPPTPDTVMVGAVGHMAAEEVRSLVIVGMQDQGNEASGELLSEQERSALSQWQETEIGMSAAAQQALRQSDYYRTLALARERLLLTHAQSTQEGDALRPGSVLMDVKELFPQVRERGGVQGEDDRPVAPRTALDGLTLHLRALAEGAEEELPAVWQEAFAWLWAREPYHGVLELALSHLNAPAPTPPLSPDRAWRLFGRDQVSISRLEEFAACPYRHFVHYGLSPVQRRPFAFEADQRGDFFHAALSAFADQAAQLPDWPAAMDEEQVGLVMDEVLAPLVAQWADGPLAEDARGRALGRQYVDTVKRGAWLFTRHMRNSTFTTQGTEVAFGEEGGLPPVILTLPDDSRVALRGKIDRIDRYEGDQGLYLRVVDYKSSQKRLEPVRMWYGLQLQLLLYLKAATAGTGGKPAGAFYFTVSDPMCDTPEDLKEAAEAAIAKELRLKGVVLADAEVVAAMDAQEPGLSLEKVFNQDGSISRTATAVDMEEMCTLLEHARQVAGELAGEMRRGEIAVRPAAIGTWSACTYCDFKGVCGIDPRSSDPTRRLPDMDKQEFRERLANEHTTAQDAPKH